MNPVILDMDPGVDDALALILALKSPELEVLGVTTVSGNVPVDLGTRNALRVLHLICRNDVAVHTGAARPLLREPIRAEAVHGSDGLGDIDLPDSGRRATSEDAVGFLVRTVLDRPRHVSLIATGPLTNLALAIGRSPGILREARQVIIMGGAVREEGNATPTGEFNFVADPHAAKEVIGCGADITLVPLDVTHRCVLSGSVLYERVEPRATPVSDFVNQATLLGREHAQRLEGIDGFHLHDPLAVAMGIDRSMCEAECMRLDVEADGALTAGQVVADRRRYLDDARRVGSNVKVCVGVSQRRFRAFFLERILNR